MKHPVEPLDELIVCFDDNGKEIEPHTRAEVHALPLKYWHGVVSVTVVNQAGEILCPKRSEKLSHMPGRWQANFSGHVSFGQTFKESGVRELFEESGIKKEQSELFFLEETKNLETKHIGQAFVCRFDGEISDLYFADGEITEARWLNMETAWQEKLASPEKWTTGCSPERQEKIKQWLKNYV